jgi:AcrR family transcriptional regulator
MTHAAELSPLPLRPPGRPRSPRAERAILDATLELLASEGFGRMTVEGVAAAAGVGKATIYRRWASKLDLVLAAVGELSAHPLPELTAGSTREDLIALLRHIIEALTSTVAGRILPELVAETARSPELLGILQDFWISRRGLMLQVLRRGSAQGDLPGDVDHELIADLLYGPVHYRFLISGGPLGPELADRLVDAVMRRVGPAPGSPDGSWRGGDGRAARRRSPVPGTRKATPVGAVRGLGDKRRGASFSRSTTGSSVLPASVRVDQELQHLTDRPLPPDGLSHRQVSLDLVAIPAAVPVLHDVAGLGQVRDDAVGGALGDAERGGDVAQAHAGVVGDAYQDLGMVGEEAPLRHERQPYPNITRNILLVSSNWNSMQTARPGCHRPPAASRSTERMQPC